MSRRFKFHYSQKWQQSCKWLELQILRFFLVDQVHEKFVSSLTDIGVVLHFAKTGNKKYDKKVGELMAKQKLELSNVDHPYNKNLCHIQISKESLPILLANQGCLAMGRGYVNGDWCPGQDGIVGPDMDIYEFFYRSMNAGHGKGFWNPWNRFLHHLEFNYNLGNSFFESFLDSSLTYSCAYWKTADNLEDAQRDKLDLIAKKLALALGMTLLDIGCGWGTLCKYFAMKYKVTCVGVTLSQAGAEYASKICRNLPVQILQQDYREVEGTFDRIVTLETFEHVGIHNHSEFIDVVNRCLKDDGVFLFHVSGISGPANLPRTDPWGHQCMPNYCLPYLSDILLATQNTFTLEDCHNMSSHFEKNFLAYSNNLVKNRTQVCEEYGVEVFQTWKFSFLGAAAMLKAGHYQLWQLVFTKIGYQGVIEAVR